MNNTKKIEQLLLRIERAHVYSINAMDAWARSGNSTATKSKHWERYERNQDKFDLSLEELRVLLLGEAPELPASLGSILQSTSKKELNDE